MNSFALRALALVLLIMPAHGSAQQPAGIGDVLSGLREGGGWVGIPIVAGEGRFSTVQVPTMALSIAGCVNVWFGHSGTWEIEARERVLGSVLRIDATPGIGVPFEHDFGLQAQVDIDFHWSEARDTTLLLWVGIDRTGEGPASVCEPGEVDVRR